MRCVVINLPDAVERRRIVGDQFSGLNLPYELWPATKASSLTIEQKRSVDHCSRATRTKRPFDAPSLACLMSHIAVFRNLINSGDEMAAVFEDDVFLHPNLPDFLNILEGKSNKFDIVMLHGNTNNLPYFPVYRTSRVNTIGRIRYSNFGAYGYVITRDSAAHLLKTFPRPTHEIDRVLACFWENGLRNVLWVDPPLIHHNYALTSQISDAREAMRAEHRTTLLHDPLFVVRRFWNMGKQSLVRRYRFQQLRNHDRTIDPFSF